MLSKIFWSLLMLAVGLSLIIKTKQVKDFNGNFNFAEKWFGMGGTYSFLKLLGVLIMVATFLWLTGTLDRIVPAFLKNPGITAQ